MTVGVIVMNLETVYNIRAALRHRKPVIEKWLTIHGCVPNPCVLRVPVGTCVGALFERLGIIVPEGYTVLDGGPSMGAIVNPTTAVVKKNSKSFLLLPRTAPAVVSKVVDLKTHATRAATACCQCTRCTDMCPRNLLGYPLYPHMMVRSVTTVAEVTPQMVLSASLCCSCGICELAACCQNISPRAMIQEFKGILAKNKLKFVATEDVSADPAREYRKLPSDRWMMHLGVSQFAHNPVKTVLDGYEPHTVEIGMNGHIGAPSVPCVKVGDKVSRGDKIADAAAGLSMPQHASICGTVIAVDEKRIVIEAN
jgi:Na+-translocating ferredoxin:NAD+ oxidoreductase RnfC subunit